MKVLSLFNGISCGLIALKNAGITVDKYYSSEVDKYANLVTEANFPEVVQLGDVTKWREWNLDWSEIGLLIGGSPCQGFSFAGKQLNFDDPRSSLFFCYVDILEHIRKHNPDVKFLLENVKMKKEFQDVISGFLGTAPVMIDSALVSAQTRKRLYWANWEFGQPEDKGILLRDILEDDECLLLSDMAASRIVKNPRNRIMSDEDNKAGALMSVQYKMGGDMLCKAVLIIDVKSPLFTPNYLQYDVSGKGNKSQDQRAFYYNGKHGTLTSFSGGGKCKVIVPVCVNSKSGRNGIDGLQPSLQDRIYSSEGKMPSVTPSFHPYVAYECKNGEFKVIDGFAEINGGKYKIKLPDGVYMIRKLSVSECRSLQTIPSWFKMPVSNSQAYKQLGNGWTCDVIEHIFRSMLK